MDYSLVLDPWIDQTPKVYAVADWAVHFSAAAMAGPAVTLAEEIIEGLSSASAPAKFIEVRQLIPYLKVYMFHRDAGLTRDEIEFVQALPPEKRAFLIKVQTKQKILA